MGDCWVVWGRFHAVPAAKAVLPAGAAGACARCDGALAPLMCSDNDIGLSM